MTEQSQSDLETDPRFPSGPWTGFFLQRVVPGRHMMDLHLTFQSGQLTGEGRDWVGKFILRGRYDVQDGKCRWTKRYLGRHDVSYQGFNEGKGIWGVWDLSVEGSSDRGGFHIWPEGMEDPTGHHLTEEADLPVVIEDDVAISDPVALPLGAEETGE